MCRPKPRYGIRIIFGRCITLRMVDPHQVLIDNYNGNTSSTITDTRNLPANLIPMNESDATKPSNPDIGPGIEVQSVVTGSCEFDVVNYDAYEQRHNVHTKVAETGEIMCGPSPRISTSSTIQSIDTNASVTANAYLVTQNGDTSSVTANHFDIHTISDIATLDVSTTKECAIVTNQQINESNDSYQKQTIPSTSISSAEQPTKEYSAEVQTNTNRTAVDYQIDSTHSIAAHKMDSRKVEPLRININRDPIKTKIKLGPPGDRQTISPKSSSSSNNSAAGCDECDDANEMMPHENQQIYPKITIKPIVKPPTETDHHHNHSAGSHASSSSSTHEAIPKLKIKKVDANNSNSNLTPVPTHSAALNNDDITGNYQTHLLSESSPTVPK